MPMSLLKGEGLPSNMHYSLLNTDLTVFISEKFKQNYLMWSIRKTYNLRNSQSDAIQAAFGFLKQEGGV